MRLPQRLRQLQQTFRNLTDADNEDLPRSQRGLLYAIELIRFAVQKLQQDRASQMAAALTYHTLFSLLPTLVLTLVVASAFVSSEQLDDLKDQTVGWVLQWLDTPRGVDPSATPSTGSTDPDEFPAVGPLSPTQQLVQQRKEQYASTAEKLDEQLATWLDQLQQVNFGSIGVVGVLIFIYGATALLATVESSFNRILRAEENRPWFLRFPLYYTTLTLAPVVLLAGQWAQNRFIGIVSTSGPLGSWLAGPFVFLSPLLTTWVVLLLVYLLLPNATIRVRPAAIGSFVAALALGVAVEAFSLYVSQTASTSLYGALALLPLFLLLLWIIWQIVLFGLEVASIIQFAPDPAQRRKRQQQAKADPDANRLRVLDPRLIIPVLARFAHAFRDGKPLTATHVAQHFQLPTHAAESLLDALVKHGHLHRVDPAGQPFTDDDDPTHPHFALHRAPETIALPDLLATARTLGRPDVEPVNVGLASLDRCESESAEHRTLADLL